MNISFFDAHCDTVSLITHERQSLCKNDCHVDLKRGCAFANYVQFFAIWDRIKPDGRHLYASFLEQHAYFTEQLEKYNSMITLCKSAGEAKRANESGKIAAFISVEGAELLACDIPKLEKAYEMGVRALTLTWNDENRLAGGCGSPRAGGLTGLGREFVSKAHALGILVDISHICESSFWDVCMLSKRPVIASHSNSKKLCKNKRNLTDEQFEAIIALKGFVGVTLYSYFLSDSGKAKIYDVLRHIEHFLALGGSGHIGIGTDFDGCDVLPDGIRGLGDMGKLYEAMLRANYSESLVRGIFYNNLMRVVENVCGI